VQSCEDTQQQLAGSVVRNLVGAKMASDAWKAHAALLLVQLNYGGYHVIAKLALSGGINQLVFCVLRDVVALAILGPLAYVKDKETRPIFSGYFLFSFFFLGLTGIFGNQLLFTLGLNFTSPAYAAALQPAIPVFTFLLALTVGTETVNWQRIDGKAKVGGVLVCVAGAVVMALYKGPVLLGDGFSDLNLQGMAMAGKPAPEPVSWLATLLIDAGVDMWHIGVVCLIGNCFCLATYIVYQAPLLSNYPALSMTAYSYLFGAGLMSLTGCFFANGPSDWTLTRTEIACVLFFWDCGISAQLLAVDLVKQDVGTFFSCTVHASPATRLIDPFTHISKEFTLFGKWHWWRVDHIGPILGNMGPTQGCAHCIDITAVDAKHPSLHEGRVITEG